MKKILLISSLVIAAALIFSSFNHTQWKEYHDRKKGILFADSLYVQSEYSTTSKAVLLVVDSSSKKTFHQRLDITPLVTVGDANYILSEANVFVTLGSPSTVRNLTLPDAAQFPGEKIIIRNPNSSGSNWTYANAGSSVVKDASGSTVTVITANSVKILYSDHTNWNIAN